MQWLMLQQEQLEYFAIANGLQYNVWYFLNIVAEELGIAVRWDGAAWTKRLILR